MSNAILPPLVNCPHTGLMSQRIAALTTGTRAGLIALGLLLAGLLVTARWLVPDSSGIGTHEQLGLEPCFTLRLWHIRCPSCGMTTAWSHTMRGHFDEAVLANAGGAITCMLAMVISPWTLVSGLNGRWTGWKPTESALLCVAVAVVGITLLDYFVRSGAIDQLLNPLAEPGLRSERWNVLLTCFPQVIDWSR
jgi:hypothetical protein